jgi:hypothetical protein
MSYIGNIPTTAAFPFDQFSGTGSQTAFTLSQAPASTTSIVVAVSGVTQNPNTYSVSGTTLTFTGAPPSGTNNIGVLLLGLPTLIGVPGSGTVGVAQLSATGSPSSSTFLRGDNTWSATPSSITSDTAQAATSGTFKDFTAPFTGVKRITVMFSGVSTNGTSKVIVQLGDAGGIETTGYSGSVGFVESSIAATSFSTGFIVEDGTNVAAVRQGLMTICLLNSLTWIESSNVARSDQASICVGAGTKTLSDVLTQVRITTANGTDTFDAGTINILWE